MFDIIDVKAGIEAENEIYAEEVRAWLNKTGTRLINVMASPGAGKTTLLCRIIDVINADFSIGVIEADVDADVDARTVQEHGAKVVQLHTGGSCHMDGRMTLVGLKSLDGPLGPADPQHPRLVFLENIGNLVCPAEFDTGADTNLVILSVPEGDDKPLKYPLMFTVADCIAVSKTDTAEIFDFSVERFRDNVEKLNPGVRVFPLSARTGEGIAELVEWIINEDN